MEDGGLQQLNSQEEESRILQELSSWEERLIGVYWQNYKITGGQDYHAVYKKGMSRLYTEDTLKLWRRDMATNWKKDLI